MDKEILLDALNDLDPELVEEGAAPRRRPGRRALILAAALAAAVCIMGATGVLERALLMTGVDIVRTPHRAWVSFRFAEAPYTVEGERVYFTADGQHTDITAQIDENIPYIYETEHEGRPTWLMVGVRQGLWAGPRCGLAGRRWKWPFKPVVAAACSIWTPRGSGSGSGGNCWGMSPGCPPAWTPSRASWRPCCRSRETLCRFDEERLAFLIAAQCSGHIVKGLSLPYPDISVCSIRLYIHLSDHR